MAACEDIRGKLESEFAFWVRSRSDNHHQLGYSAGINGM